MEKDKIYQDSIKILQIEKSKPVIKYTFNSIEVWPFLRVSILDRYIKQNRDKKISVFKKNNFFNLKLLFTHVAIFMKSKTIFNKYLRNIQLKETDILIVAQENDYFDKIDNKDYNRFCDPFYELLNDTKKVKKITIGNQKSNLDFLNKSLYINCEHLLLYYFSKYYLLSFLPKRSLSKFFKKAILDLNLEVDLNFCVNNFVKILAFEKLFSEVLSKTQPKIIFFKMYYSVENMGLTLAAKKLKIKVVDIQHGKNGEYNHMMSHWSTFPENGYKLLPDYFWTWGDSFSKNIKNYYPNNFEKHRTISGGNLWLSKCIHNQPYVINENEKLFLNKIKSEKCILFSLQPINKENTIPDWIANTIAKTPDHFWLIRKHPRQSIEDINFKNINKLNNVDINFSSSLPLSILLNYSLYNITLWSSVCIDALEFDVKSAIIHKEGEKIYQKEIESGILDYCTNENDLINLIYSSEKINLEPKKMITDPKTIKSNLLKLIGNNL